MKLILSLKNLRFQTRYCPRWDIRDDGRWRYINKIKFQLKSTYFCLSNTFRGAFSIKDG
ncbi:unnamed protein product [Moneuplotes crassus]|uniref:Uncharacterized protein n=1 Tax=Euplotes crassus TaxID=5936 RepID=A0AAD2D9J5_EUPCR|nr:unnamed protein product [Moneuplotes crassus]